jgi:DNA-binding transcriptional ArsR family regulator
MNCTINTSVDYIMEAIVLLYNYVNEEDYPSLKKKLVSKYSLNATIQSKFDVIIKISNYVYENLTIDKERLNYYFRQINEESICIARMLFSIQFGDRKDSMELSIDRIKELEPNIIYSRMIDYFVDTGLLSGKEVDFSNQSQEYYFELLDKLNVEPEIKWNISKAFINYKKYSDSLGEILEDVIRLINDCIEDIDLLTKDCVDYWTEYLKEKELSEFLKKYFNINLELENITPNVRMIPFIFGCNTLTWMAEYKEASTCKDQNHLLMYTGILFSEDFNLNLRWFDKTEANSYLKLLSDKSKMDILLYIKDKRAYGQELATQFNLTTATISHHMSALHTGGFINLERENNRVYYSLDKENIILFLDNVKHMLTD